MSNQNPRFLDLIKIYWSITWRANTFGAMIIIILFCFCPFLLHFLIHFGKLEVFREHLFSLLLFPASSEKIKPASSSLLLYFGLWNFIWDYLLFGYGFRHVLQQEIYPNYLHHLPPYAGYNKIFLIPLLLYSLIEPLLSSFIDYNLDNQIVLTIVFLLIYFTSVLALLKRAISNQWQSILG